MTDVGRARSQVVVEGVLLGIVLGAVLGVLWWLLTPPVDWAITADGSVVPAVIGHDDWFAADGWFLGLGLVLGAGLTSLRWPRGRAHPVALAIGTTVGAGLLSLTGWAVGGALGPADPATLVDVLPAGEVVAGSLGLRAPAVLLAPLLGALGLLAVLLASAAVAPGPGEGPAGGAEVPALPPPPSG